MLLYVFEILNDPIAKARHWSEQDQEVGKKSSKSSAQLCPLRFMISLMEVSNNTAAPVEKSSFADLQALIFSLLYILHPNVQTLKGYIISSSQSCGLVRGTLHHWERVPHIFTFDFRYLHFSSHPSSFPSFPPHRHFGNLGIPAWATSEDVHIRWTDWTFHIFCQASTSQKSVNRAFLVCCNSSAIVLFLMFWCHIAEVYFLKFYQLDMNWIYPPPSNSGKWRFIGIPY